MIEEQPYREKGAETIAVSKPYFNFRWLYASVRDQRHQSLLSNLPSVLPVVLQVMPNAPEIGLADLLKRLEQHFACKEG